VGPRAGLDEVEKRKFLTIPGLELRPLGRPARSKSTLSRHLFTRIGKKTSKSNANSSEQENVQIQRQRFLEANLYEEFCLLGYNAV
jgi:hypothetical protein